MRIFLILLIFLSACAVQPYRHEFKIENLKVIYTDNPSDVCQTEAVACYLRLSNTIVCSIEYPYGCGHELCHATFGDSAHKKECAIY